MHRLGILAVFILATCSGCYAEKERVPSKIILPDQDEEVAEAADVPVSAPSSDSAASDSAAASEAPMESESPMESAAQETASDDQSSATAESTGPVMLPRLQGRITVTGTPPQLPPVAVGAQAATCNVPQVPSEAVVVGSDGGLANCIIFLKEVPDGIDIPPMPEEPLVVDQKGCQFTPHVTFVRAGQLVHYLNSDTFSHNVHTNPFRNTGLNNIAGPGEVLRFTYDLPEVRPTPFSCDIHKFMSGYHMVLDHPWCAISDENGRFEISGLPEGELEFVAWHEKKGYIERSFTVQIDAGSDVERNFEVAASDLAN